MGADSLFKLAGPMLYWADYAFYVPPFYSDYLFTPSRS